MRAYSGDLRERALRACEAGESTSSIAARLEVSESWVRRVRQRFEDTGERGSLKMGGHIQPRLEALEGETWCWIAEKPGLTLEEMVARLSVESGIRISVLGLWYPLERWNIAFKKSVNAQERTRPDVAADREAWKA